MSGYLQILKIHDQSYLLEMYAVVIKFVNCNVLDRVHPL